MPQKNTASAPAPATAPAPASEHSHSPAIRTRLIRDACPETISTRMGADRWRTIVVHNSAMKVAEKAVRQSVSLPPRLARQVANMAKSRKLSKNRMLVELIENGICAGKQKQQQFYALAERFRNEHDPEAASRLGDELGRMVFGG